MENIQLKFKSFKKELIEEEGDFQAASLPPNPEQPSAATPGATIRLLLLVHWFLRISLALRKCLKNLEKCISDDMLTS